MACDRKMAEYFLCIQYTVLSWRWEYVKNMCFSMALYANSNRITINTLVSCLNCLKTKRMPRHSNKAWTEFELKGILYAIS